MYIIIFLIIIAFIIILCFAERYAFNKVILDKRKSKDEMIKAMYKRFSSDYRNYKDLEFENLEVTSSDGYKLKGYYYNKNKDSNRVVIIHHGYTANHYVCFQFADIFFELGFNVLLVDMRSHGESEGKYITYGYKEREDLNLWVELMRKRVGGEGLIGLHGQSMGGATVLMYGGKYGENIDFIVADCAYSRGKDIIKDQFKKSKVPFYPIYNMLNRRIKKKCDFDMNKISPIDDICSSNIPTLFIHGLADELVPYNMSKEMYNSKKGEYDRLLLIDDALHVGSYSKNEKKYKNEVRDFINDILDKNKNFN